LERSGHFSTRSAPRGSLRARGSCIFLEILGGWVRGVGFGVIEVFRMFSGMGGRWIVLEQIGAIAIQLGLFRTREPYMWGVLAEYGYIWGQEDLFRFVF
jgi:hypothetical protein